MTSRPTRRPECTHEDCGSKRFHTGDDGFTYCDQGHQQGDRGTAIAEDTGELVIRGPRSRKRSSDAESTASKRTTFSGTRLLEHYLLCVQLILRKQLRWLIDTKELPEELETIVKDLWALRLKRLQARVSYDSETDTEVPSSQRFSSSQSEGEAPKGTRRRKKRDEKPKEDTPRLVELLALCYIGVMLLRIPLTVADMSKWINDGVLLYYQAAREVPLGMRGLLTGQYQTLLEPQSLLQPQTLHQHVLDMVTLLKEEFGMEMPAINTSLVLYRWIRDLALPLEIFASSQRLARILTIDFTFREDSWSVFLRYPEVQLMALVVVATKLLLPFDKLERYPDSATDLTAIALDWDAWVVAHGDDGEDERKLTFEQALNFSDSDCINAADEQLDAYLDWYADNIASEDLRERGRAGKARDFRRALFEMFPTDTRRAKGKQREASTSNAAAGRKLRQVQRTVLPLPVLQSTQANKNALRPGSYYRRYRGVDELSGPAKIFFEKAAQLAGLSVEGMVHSVFSIERKLQKHEEALRKTDV